MSPETPKDAQQDKADHQTKRNKRRKPTGYKLNSEKTAILDPVPRAKSLDVNQHLEHLNSLEIVKEFQPSSLEVNVGDFADSNDW